MPSLITHLKISQNICKDLQLPKYEFYLGNLLPDFYGNNHKESHYSNNRIPNINNFMNEFSNLNLTPVEIGYLCHLLTDKFYNDFIFNNYIELSNNKLISIKINGNKEYYSEEKINDLKHSVYDNYDSYIIKNNFVEPFENLSFIDNLKMPRLKSLLYDKEHLKKQIKVINSNIIGCNNQYKDLYVFSSQEELDKIFWECCIYILQFIRNNHILKGKEEY